MSRALSPSFCPRIIIVVTLILVVPSRAGAQDTNNESDGGFDPQWGISLWGLSYHIDRRIDYNEGNWGLGVRYSARPQWKWLGRDEDNRVFLELDALRNSHSGLVLPLSAGVEYTIKTISSSCRLSVVGAVTLAYYRNPDEDTSEFKFGPVPGLTLSWGHLKTNMIVVLRKSRQPFSSIVGSITIVF
jgi:hypothetical protein